MKTFETEKNNIPEGATHYSEECVGKYFCWYAVTEDDAKICVLDGRGFGYKWYKCTNEHYGCDVKPIPTEAQEEKEALDAIEKAGWNSGDIAAYKGKEVLIIAYHPHHPSVVVELPCNEYLNVLAIELSKPESPEEKEKRERLEAAYDLYSSWVSSSYGEPLFCFKAFCDAPELCTKWLAIVDKTNYRKGE